MANLSSKNYLQPIMEFLANIPDNDVLNADIEVNNDISTMANGKPFILGSIVTIRIVLRPAQ